MASVELLMFGSLQVTMEGKPLSRSIPSKGRALLAYLSVEAEPQAREKLAFILWPDQPEAHARQNLSQVVHALRECLGEDEYGQPYLLLTPASIQLNPQSSFWSDVSAFNRLVQECQQHVHPQLSTCDTCFERQQQAVALYRGDFLADFSLKDSQPFEEWSTLLRERFHRWALRLLYQLAESLEARSKIEAALEYAWRQVELEPLRESGHRQVMHLLAASGRRSEALAQFSSLKGLLQDALGVEPDAETLAEYERILHQAPQPVETHPPEARLPAMLFPLIGRQEELAKLAVLLRNPSCRLVTIFGPGGVGKTHLSLEAAHHLAPDFPDGVYFISLSAYQPGSLLWVLLVEALRFPLRDKQNPEQQVLDYLREKKALLIFDGFENALEQTSWLADLLRGTSYLTALVTSRSRLEISAEQVFLLGGMPAPASDQTEIAEQFDAVQLFLTFASHRQPDFKLDEHNRPGVARLCRLLKGLPLGLLLASAWIELYSPQEIAAQIENNLDFLKVTWSDVPARQRSLLATFDYSWRQLTDAEQRVLTALAVFRDGFSLQAAKEVSQAPVRLLQSLVDKSMVNHTPDNRYQLHDLLHQFANRLLEENQDYFMEVCSHHSHFFLGMLSNWGKDLKGAHQPQALEAVDREVENLRLAWRWAVVNEYWDGIAAGLEGMAWYADLRFRFEEGERACRTAREAIPVSLYPYLVASLSAWQAHFLRRLGQVERAGGLLKAELEQLENLQEQGTDVRLGKAQILFELGELNISTDREIASRYYKDSLALYDELQDECGAVDVLISLGKLTHHNGNFSEASSLLTQALTILRKIGDPSRLARTLRWLAFNEARLGKLAQAEQILRESVSLRQASGNCLDAALAKDDLGTLISWSGKFAEGAELLEQSLAAYQKLGYKSKEIWAHCMLGLQYLLQGNYQKTRPQAQAVLQMAHPGEAVREIALANYLLGCAALAERDFPTAFDLLGESLRLYRQIDQKDELGWTLIARSYAARALSQTREAHKLLFEAAQIATTVRAFSTATVFVAAAALFSMDQGNFEKALELQALANRFPIISQARWYEDIAWHQISTAAYDLPKEVISAAQERGFQRDLFATVEELLGEISSQISISSPLADHCS